MRSIRGPLVLVVLGFFFLAAALEVAGPFPSRPEMGYRQFLDEVAAGRVQRVVWWRDRVEVTRGDEVFSVRVPAGADFPDEFYAAAAEAKVGMSWSGLPDQWVWTMTPIVPAALVAAAAVLLVLACRGRASRRPASGAVPPARPPWPDPGSDQNAPGESARSCRSASTWSCAHRGAHSAQRRAGT